MSGREGGRGWGAKNEQFPIGRRIRANIPLSVDESEVQKGGHFCADSYMVTAEVEHGAPPADSSAFWRTWRGHFIRNYPPEPRKTPG